MGKINKAFKDWEEVLIITLLIRLFWILIPILIHPVPGQTIYGYWIQWDSPHYIDIAEDWYIKNGEQSLWIVFYPFYPILIKLVSIITQNFSLSAVIIPIIFSIAGSIAIFELTLLDFKKSTALKAVWFLNIFPTAYFLQAAYTESLYIFLSVITILFFRKKSYFYSGLTALLSSFTRINGLFLIPVLIMEKRPDLKNLKTYLLAPFGFFLYLLTNYLIFKDPFYFIRPLEQNWYKKFALPWEGIKKLIGTTPDINNFLYPSYIFEFLSLILITVSIILVFFKIRKSYALYLLLNLVLFTSTDFIVSTPRYTLSLFPIFILLGTINNRYLVTLISLFFITSCIFFGLRFTLGQWAF